MVNPDGSTACKCSQKCPKNEDNVCGSDGRNYKNACVLRAENCQKKKRVSVAGLGNCGKFICNSHY